MPQMSPMSWTSLFILFSLIFLMTTTMNYFLFEKAPIVTNKKSVTIKANWKW